MKNLTIRKLLLNSVLLSGCSLIVACSQATSVEQKADIQSGQQNYSEPTPVKIMGEFQSSAQQASLHLVDVHKPWPTADELSDSEVAENLFGEHYVIAIDTSGSMGDSCESQNKMVAAKSAAIEFLSNIPQDASVGLAIFGSRVGMQVPLDFNNHANVESAISQLSPGGSTPMSQAIESGYASLVKAGNTELGYGNYNLIILGDGEPKSVQNTQRWLDKIAQTTPINVTTIGFCADISVLDRVAINYQPASNAGELRAAFATVLAEATEIDGSEF